MRPKLLNVDYGYKSSDLYDGLQGFLVSFFVLS